MKKTLCVIVAGLLLPLAAQAQQQFTFDLGGGKTHHQFNPDANVVSLAPRYQMMSGIARMDLGFLYTRGTALAWNAEGNISAAFDTRLGKNVSLEMAGSGWWTAHELGSGTRELLLQPMLRIATPAAILGFQAGLGRASTKFDNVPFGTMGLSLAGNIGAIEFLGQVSRTAFARAALRSSNEWANDGISPDTLIKRYVNDYADAGLMIGATALGARFEAGVEQRLGKPEFRATGWRLQGARAIAEHLLAFVSAGRILSELTTDLPARNFTAMGLRWLWGRPTQGSPRPSPERDGFRSERVGAEAIRLGVRASAATSVEVMGDFTDWQPANLIRDADGWWELIRELRPGLHRLNVRYDGGTWRAPPGLPTEKDEFGGLTGLLLIAP